MGSVKERVVSPQQHVGHCMNFS